jgi:hypothetical protein
VLERLARDKHSSLLRNITNYGCKKLYEIETRSVFDVEIRRRLNVAADVNVVFRRLTRSENKNYQLFQQTLQLIVVENEKECCEYSPLNHTLST